MPDIKPQFYHGDIDIEDVDFRGAKRRGSPEDEHRTIGAPGLKLEFSVPDDQADVWIERCKEINRAVAPFMAWVPDVINQIAGFLGLKGKGPLKFAMRVYDND